MSLKRRFNAIGKRLTPVFEATNTAIELGQIVARAEQLLDYLEEKEARVNNPNRLSPQQIADGQRAQQKEIEDRQAAEQQEQIRDQEEAKEEQREKEAARLAALEPAEEEDAGRESSEADES